MFLSHPLRDLPTPILAAIVFMAVKDMIDLRALHRLRRVNRIEHAGGAGHRSSGWSPPASSRPDSLAVIFSIVMLLRWAANPHTAVLGRSPGTARYGDAGLHHKNEIVPGILLFRVEGGIFYFNVDSVKSQFLARVEEYPGPLELVVFDLSTSPQVDLAGARMIGELHDRLTEKGIHPKCWCARRAALLRAVAMEARWQDHAQDDAGRHVDAWSRIPGRPTGGDLARPGEARPCATEWLSIATTSPCCHG